LIEKAEMLFERLFATYRNLPKPSVVTSKGCDPAGNGEPGTGLRAPVSRSNENTVTLFDPALVTKTNFPAGSIAIRSTDVPPVANGDPATGVRTPVSGSLR
jgi:hypothetical protein